MAIMSETFAASCLSEKRILISGALGALGRRLVRRFGEHGARLALCDLPDHPEGIELGPRESYFRCDVTEEKSVRELFRQVEAEWKAPPNVVLAHAGVVQDRAFTDYGLGDWESLMAINLRGSFLFAREAARSMLASGSPDTENPGKVLFTTSWVKTVPWPRLAGYNASKAAIDQLMRTCAREFGDRHILFNAVAPGMVATGMAQEQYDVDPDYRARADRAIPLGRLQPPESVCDAFLFLCSDASNYMTGQTLIVDGGASLYPMI